MPSSVVSRMLVPPAFLIASTMAIDFCTGTVGSAAPPQLLNVPAGDAGAWTLHSIDAGYDYVATLALRRAA